MVKDKSFRGDLFFRLNVMTVPLPPVRDRKEDIPALANYFIGRLNEEYGRGIEGVSPEALECMKKYDWPGNVRELRNAMERAMMLEPGMMLSAEYFTTEIRHSGDGAEGTSEMGHPAAVTDTGYITLPPDGISIEEVEKELIQQALERFNGNQTKAAESLRMSRDTLRYRIKKFGMQSIGKE